MLDKLTAVEARYSQIEARLAASETYEDPALVAKLNKEQTERLSRQSRIPISDLIEYEGNAPCLWGIHISDLLIYDQPKNLSDFKPWHRECKYDHLGLAIPKCESCHDCKVEKAPQSYMFVEELK